MDDVPVQLFVSLTEARNLFGLIPGDAEDAEDFLCEILDIKGLPSTLHSVAIIGFDENGVAKKEYIEYRSFYQS
jgi:hypothetical protein